MNNLEAKQEAVKNAYGEYWEIVKDYVDENGWASYPNVQKHDYNFGKLEFKDDCTFLRPESLQGIENNNGWVKIENEADLPNNEKVWICTSNNRVLISSKAVLNWFLKNPDNKITHYQPIEKPKPPIY